MSKSLENKLKNLKDLKNVLSNKYDISPKIFDKHINKTYKKMHNEIENALNYQPDIFKIIYKRFIKEHKPHIDKSIKYWENVRCIGFDKKCKEQQQITKKLKDIIYKLNSNLDDTKSTSYISRDIRKPSVNIFVNESKPPTSPSEPPKSPFKPPTSPSEPPTNASNKSYNFWSVPINNPSNYCYQASVFQLLFSIDIIRNESSDYKTYTDNIQKNVFDILNEMNINKKTGQVINKKNIQDNLASAFRSIGTQQDAQEFLNYIFDSFENINKINNEITFYDTTYSFCKKNINLKFSDLMDKPYHLTDDEKTIYPTKTQITSSDRNKIMKIKESVYKKFGYLFNINGIHAKKILILPITSDNIDWTIQKLLDDSVDVLESSTSISNITKNDSDCEKITQKTFLKIPDELNYICFMKRLVENNYPSYNFLTFKNLTINNVIFELRGYISHRGTLKYIYGQVSAESGHYVYISIENNKQVLYNDSAKPMYINDNDNYYISRGYIFLYKRVR
jgi:hypothetical protein